MPKQVTRQQLEQVEQLVAASPEGISIAELEAALAAQGNPVNRRTLFRRLSELVSEKRIVAAGEKRGRVYKPRRDATARLDGVQTKGEVGEIQAEEYVPLSPEGAKIRDYVRQPRQQRMPISYKSNFLDSYTPNVTAYLPLDLREQLHILGKSPDDERPAGTFAREILNRLLIDLSWSSSRLEGNTYSRLDTERLFRFGEPPEGKDARETQMIVNHKNAIEMLVNQADLVGFNSYTILNLHAQLSDGLLENPLDCGRIRQRAVEIGGSVYIPLAMPQRIEEIFHRILAMAEAIQDPFEQAFFVMAHIPYLQPFIDVNERVSRLAANIPLIKSNLCPLSFIDVPERSYIDAMIGVYELNQIDLLRDVFYWAYARSCQQYVAVQQSLIAPDPFRLRYRTELAEVIRAFILGRLPATTDSVRAVIPGTLPKADHVRFIEIVLKEFNTLYEGNIARFGIRPLEFAAWKQVKMVIKGES